MGYQLIDNITTINKTETGGRSIEYIVLHYTGNSTDTAKANANYFKSVYRGASAHYFVDKTTVYRAVEDSNIAWSVGKNYGSNNMFGKVTNANSLNIEMCSDEGKIADETFENTVTLTRLLMATYGISAANVVRHWDVCSKQCPGWTGWGTNGSDSTLWDKFKARLTENEHNKDAYTLAGESSIMYGFVTNALCNVRIAPNVNADTVTALVAGSRQGIDKITSDAWGHIGNDAGWINLKECSPLVDIPYQLKKRHCYVRMAGRGTKVIADLKRGSKQSICFIDTNYRGYLGNYAGWVELKNFKRI